MTDSHFQRLLRLGLALTAASLAQAAPAHAAPADVIQDCAADGDLDRSYSLQDLLSAYLTLPADVAAYTDCPDVIARAIGRAGGPSAQALAGLPGAPGGPGATGSASLSRSVRVTISRGAVRLSRTGFVRVRVSCPTARAVGVLNLRTRRRGRFVRLGLQPFTCPARRRTIVKVRLSEKTERAVRRQRRVLVSVTAVSGSGSSVAVTSSRFRLRA